MHRKQLIEDLRRYLRRHPEEQQVAARFLHFVAGHAHCFQRDCLPGHVTASAWLVDPGRRRVLLTHHRKLNRWLQPGGHCDGHPATLQVALREAEEETGLGAAPCRPTPLDIDIYAIPPHGREPAHNHYDLCYAMVAAGENFQVSKESLALAWVPFADIPAYTQEASVLRMLAKWRSLQPP